jgi:hypothetical protein
VRQVSTLQSSLISVTIACGFSDSE